MAKPARPLIAPLCETKDWLAQRETALVQQIASLRGQVQFCEEELFYIRRAREAIEA